MLKNVPLIHFVLNLRPVQRDQQRCDMKAPGEPTEKLRSCTLNMNNNLCKKEIKTLSTISISTETAV